MSYKRSKYFLTPEKRKINYLLANKSSKITVVFFHGFMSDMLGKKPLALQRICRKLKVNFLKFEYSGHGSSSGKFINGNISKWTSDAKNLIRSKTKNSKKFIFIGSSMGSWIALNLLSTFKKKLKGFIGIASAPEFLEELMWKKFNKEIKKTILTNKIYYLKNGNYNYPLTKQLIFDGRKNRVLKNKINLKIPIVLLHGGEDDVVPFKFSKKIFKMFKKSKRKLIKINNGDHSLSRKADLKILTTELKILVEKI